ncbi:hypothetical protein [Cellulosimicrobium aquatile]|uniref:hypothetical protein n=1 Tax=Cellulosimicrobium aquatile TaxID=1612203 RepID=UPI001178242A|nr:hypothetical protein [Cellulosimicrobium aquatile]
MRRRRVSGPVSLRIAVATGVLGWWGGLAGFVTVLVWQLSTQLVGLANVGQVVWALCWSALVAAVTGPLAGIPYALLVHALGAPLDRWEDRRQHAH